MRIRSVHIRANVLPTVVVVVVVILTGMLGLMALWEMETLSFVRSRRLKQARADVESIYLLYRLHPDEPRFFAPDGALLFDSLPQSRVMTRVRPWGLYEAVWAATSDSLVRVCRLFGAEPDSLHTFYYADNRSALTLAGCTRLQGGLRLPQNGLIYGRIGADFYSGPAIPAAAIRRSDAKLPQPDRESLARIGLLFAEASEMPYTGLSADAARSFRDSTLRLRIGDAEIGDCCLRGNIVLSAGELRIDSTCRIQHLVICARKVTVGAGACITAQIFARDTVIVEPRAVLEYPSGIYAREFAEVGDRAEVNGYVIVRDTLVRRKVTANYRQSRTARVRGLIWVEGMAQMQGIVSGAMYLRQAVYFSPQGYYKDMLYDVSLLANPHTALPLWLAGSLRRKETVCVD